MTSTETDFDFAGLVYADEAEFTIRDPQNRPTAWRVRMAGPGHPASVAFRDARNALARRLAAERDLAQAKSRVWEAPDAAAEQAQFARDFAPRVLGWSPVRFSGADFAYTLANVEKLLTDPKYSFVGAQLIEFGGKSDDFFAKPAMA
jgi:hypothetical protein